MNALKKLDFPSMIVCPHCGQTVRIGARRDRDIFRSKCIGFIYDHRQRSLPAFALHATRVDGEMIPVPDSQPVNVHVSAQCPLSGAPVTWDEAG